MAARSPGPVAGVDGCKAGWLVASGKPVRAGRFTADAITVEVFADIASLAGRFPNAKRVVIDIPIGLAGADGQCRQCDALAREMLGPRRTSVFSPPCRDAVYAVDYAQACTVNRRCTGKAFSKQAWNITGKIREVDRFLLREPDWQSRFIESHPEVCFAGLAGRPMSSRKKDVQGVKERLQVLGRWIDQVEALVEQAWLKNRPRQYQMDDLLDALVNLVVAASLKKQQRCLPSAPPFDEKGLPMQMVYRDDTGR